MEKKKNGFLLDILGPVRHLWLFKHPLQPLIPQESLSFGVVRGMIPLFSVRLVGFRMGPHVWECLLNRLLLGRFEVGRVPRFPQLDLLGYLGLYFVFAAVFLGLFLGRRLDLFLLPHFRGFGCISVASCLGFGASLAFSARGGGGRGCICGCAVGCLSLLLSVFLFRLP